MPNEKITIPDDLMQLKPSTELESVSMSELARKGSAVLRKIVASAQAMAIKVQGQGEMVTVSQRQYDEMVELINRLKQDKTHDDFARVLSLRFDDLVAGMNRPGATNATDTALFADPATLNKTYLPGATENDQGDST